MTAANPKTLDARSVAIGAGAGLAVFTAFSLIYPTSKFETTTLPASSLQDVAGTTMPDGSIYAGVSPDSGKPMYVTRKDAPLTCTFEHATKYAKKLDAHGRHDWRVPTRAELNVLFQDRAAIGGFDTTDLVPTGWYLSSSCIDGYGLIAWAQRFSDGCQVTDSRYGQTALRCVRG